MTPEGANRYRAPEAVLPVISKNMTLHQGAIENANQGVIPGTLNLILVQREAEMMQRALTVFHTEFNKIATEDLPKVLVHSSQSTVLSEFGVRCIHEQFALSTTGN